MRGFWRRFRHPLAIGLMVMAALAAGGAGLWRHRNEQILREGEQALEAREYAKAREHFERYLTIRPSAVGARLLAARAARRQKDFEAALEHLRRCREDGGDAEIIDVEYALIAVRQGDDGPVPWLRERARRDDELALTILEGLIQYDLDTYRLRQAQADLDAVLARRPTDLHALLGRGFVWERFLSYADALENYRTAVAAHPDSERARLRLADTLLMVGSPQEALEHYKWLAERGPERPEVRLGLARCKHRLGQLDEAQALLDALLADAPKYGEALWARGQLAVEQRRPAEAKAWLQRAYAVIPHDRRVSYSLERVCLELGRKDDAVKHGARVAQLDADVRRLDQVRHAVMQRPNDAALRCEAGLLFLRNGERQEGVRWLQLALRLDPSCEAARKALVDYQKQPAIND